MFKRYNMITGCGKEQTFLLSPNAMEWLPENDIVYAILKILDLLDMTPFISKYRADGSGSAFFDPRCMLGIIIYSMIRGEKSSRKIEICCNYDIGYRVIAQNLTPDHTTMYRFKKNNSQAIKEIFKDLARIIVDSDITKLGVIALDGTKIEANASLSANKKSKYIESELTRLFEESQEIDTFENKRDSTIDIEKYRLTEPLIKIEKRKEVLTAAQEKLKERQQIEAEKQEKRICERKKIEEERGKKKPGRKLSEPQKVPLPDTKVNLTDPDSQIMSTNHGLIQGLNGQIVVTEDQYILVAALTDEQNDKKQLIPMLKEINELFSSTKSLEKPHTLVADAGYYSYENISAEPHYGIHFLIPNSKERKILDYALNDGCISRIEQVCGMIVDDVNLTIAELASVGTCVWQEFLNQDKIATKQEIQKRIMDARVRSPSGREQYRKRKTMVEPVFGNIKHNFGFRRFSLKGKEKCEGEFLLAAISHNIVKIFVNSKLEKVVSYIRGNRGTSNKMENNFVIELFVDRAIQLNSIKNRLWDRAIKSYFHFLSRFGKVKWTTV